MEHCDVLIVGGGPGGSSCAKRLSTAGLDVVVLDKAVSSEDATEKAVALAKAALSEGDTLTYHTLAGGPLRFYFERRGIDREALKDRFAALDTSPAGKLLPKFKGAKSVPAVVTMSANVVDMGLAFLRATYSPMVETLKTGTARAVPVR